MTATFILGDVRDVLAALPDGSVDLVLTSPPFLALRSYLPADHPDKHREIGGEPTPAEFIDTLLGLSAEFRRVLAPHGSIAIELGDTYAGSGGAGGDYAEGGLRDGQQAFTGSARKAKRKPKTMNTKVLAGDPAEAEAQAPPDRLRTRRELPGWPLDKCLTMIPELFRVALAYGLNPLTGAESPAGKWRARNVVRWCRPNPPVGSLGDKVRPATSDMVIACTERIRYFDLDGIREPANPAHKRPSTLQRTGIPGRTNQTCNPLGPDGLRVISNPAGAPPLDHWWADPDDENAESGDLYGNDAWLVSTEGYKGSHYATWPRKLLTRPIVSMCPERVCTTCGQPSRRLTTSTGPATNYNPGERERDRQGRGRKQRTATDPGRLGLAATGQAHGNGPDGPATIGWTCCGCGDGCTPTTWTTKVAETEQGQDTSGEWIDLHEWQDPEPPVATRTRRKRTKVLDHPGACCRNHWRAGVVLDPFAGSGTTLSVATGHNRDAIGIDFDARNIDLARERVGPLFFDALTLAEWCAGASARQPTHLEETTAP